MVASGDGRGGVSFEELHQAEVEDLDAVTLGHEQVGGLEVPVNDALGMRGFQPIDDLRRKLQDQGRLQRATSDPLLQRGALQQLHGDEVATLVLVDIVDRADVGMIEPGGGTGFPPEALDRQRPLRDLLPQELEGDVPSEPEVLSTIDDAHPTFAQQLPDPVMRDRGVEHAASGAMQGEGTIVPIDHRA